MEMDFLVGVNMKKTILIIILFALCVSISSAGVTDKLRAVIAAKNAGSAEPPSGQAFSDAFAYSDGELNSVSSGAWVKLTGSDASVSSGVFTILNDTVYVYDTPTDTISQYAAVQFLTGVSTYTGVYVRQETNDSTATKAYCLRNNNGLGLQVRYCNGASCTDIDFHAAGDISANDSLGFEVTGTGAATQWKSWWWVGQAPPARESWGNCDFGVYVTGQSATTCDEENKAATAPTGNYADSGKYVGIYSGGDNQPHDNWMGGDI